MPRHCPSCDVPLIPVSGAVEDERCPRCAGHWLPRGIPPAPARTLDAPQHEAPSPPSGTTPVRPKRYCCPTCSLPLEQQVYAYDSGIVIDRCAGCGGIWLKPGQREAIASYRQGTPSQARLAQAWSGQVSSTWRSIRVYRALTSPIPSAMVAAVYLAFAASQRDPIGSVLIMLKWLALPLACIWLPTMFRGRRLLHWSGIQALPTGDAFVILGGWIYLLSPVAALLLARM